MVVSGKGRLRQHPTHPTDKLPDDQCHRRRQLWDYVAAPHKRVEVKKHDGSRATCIALVVSAQI
jgi:hypothetical protein